MISKEKKLKLASVLKKTGEKDYSDKFIVDHILDDVKTVKERAASMEFSSTELHTVARRKLLEATKYFKKATEDLKATSDNNATEIIRLRKNIETKADKSKPRIFKNNGFLLNKAYQDLNFIGTSGVSITARDNPTQEQVDIFVTSTITQGLLSVTTDATLTGSGTPSSPLSVVSGGGFSLLTPTGTVDGVNQTFVFASAPSVIVVDQGSTMKKVSSDSTVNWTGTTNITLTVAPTFDIFGY